MSNHPIEASFHAETLRWLGPLAPRRRADAAALEAWAAETDFAPPAAFAEWAALDHGLAARYSNDDWFDFERPGVAATPDGGRALVFMSENQNNFDIACRLDAGDDPPTLYRYAHRDWIEHATRFSEAIFAHFFDWRHALDHDEDGAVRDMAYAGLIRLKPDAPTWAARLAERYREGPRTTVEIDERRFDERRFSPDPARRILAADGAGEIVLRVMAEGDAAAGAFEAELLELFAGETMAPRIFSPHDGAGVLRHVAWRLRPGWRAHIRALAETPPSDAAIDALYARHAETPLAARDPALRETPDGALAIGGPDWGFEMRMRRADRHQSRLVVTEIRVA